MTGQMIKISCFPLKKRLSNRYQNISFYTCSVFVCPNSSSCLLLQREENSGKSEVSREHHHPQGLLVLLEARSSQERYCSLFRFQYYAGCGVHWYQPVTPPHVLILSLLRATFCLTCMSKLSGSLSSSLFFPLGKSCLTKTIGSKGRVTQRFSS